MPLTKLNQEMARFYGSEPLVAGAGPVPCRLMLIGEAPGAREIETGTPFVGRAGGNLQDFLAGIGLSRADLYITNVCKFRPVRIREGRRRTVSNRTPTAAEVRDALPFLLEEIACVDPELIVTLGNTPLNALSGNRSQRIGDVHGRPLLLEEGPLLGRTLFALYHPASLIYNPGLQADYAQDMLFLRERLREMEFPVGG
ncbi:MAG: uracil-DNA glycosylase [Clostridia bacterium]|nr:uracil-DNA glycosylase [Clostridia bacterium]